MRAPVASPKSLLTPARILELALGFWGSKTLLTASRLGVFEALAEGPKDLETLRRDVGIAPRSARDFFDALVALEMLERAEGRYALSADAATFLDPSKPAYIGGFLDMLDERLYGFWGSLEDALRTGKPQNEAKSGGTLFDRLQKDPHGLRDFMAAMSGVSAGAAQAIAERFPWDRHGTFADVGCAQGGLPVAVARTHPHVTGIGWDLPAVRPVFEEYVAKHGLSHRLRFEPGDFFRDPLPRADVLVMGHILHDWSLDEKRALLRKAHEALPTGGALVVYDTIIDDDRRQNAFGLLMSLNMLIETPSGFDYTGADCADWMREAGFRAAHVEPLVGPHSMVVGTK